MNALTQQDIIDWVKYPIVDGKRIKLDDGKVVEETLSNGKTYVLHKHADQAYKLVGVK